MKPWLALIALPMIAAPQPDRSGVANLKLLVYNLAGLSRNLTDNPRHGNELHVKCSRLFGDPL
jgi:hypothetical protein